MMMHSIKNPNSCLFEKFANALMRTPLLISVATFLLWATVFSINGQITSPMVGDEFDYIGRGVLLANEGVSAIADGYRTPMIIFIISALSYFLQGDELLLGVRLFNLALVAIIPSAWLYASKYSSINRDVCVLMALFTAIWLPFYYFGSKALAEGVSFFALNLLIITTLSFSSCPKTSLNILKSIACACLIAILCISKANNILAAPACAITVFFLIKTRVIERVFICLVMAIFTAILIFPWINLVHSSSGEYKLSTTGGMNFLVGTGHTSLGMSDHLDQSVLPDKYIGLKIGFHQTPNGPSALSFEDEEALAKANKNVFEFDNISTQIGIKIWKENPIQQVIHGSLKVLHSLGGSMRGGLDYFTILFAALTIICSIFCLIEGIQRPIIYLFWMLALAGFLIAFFYLPNVRFKTFYFDSPGLLVLSATISFFIRRTSNTP